ncbi:hypothetical protein BJ978_001348 [Agromyces terreus]|uniref:DUF3073 domain-containing protein n=1 Tax=Agromyces terreus TaxID=424795 RepID=A0A9X2GXX9_9MICO|nr:hypothetical protein [Agromyces terreus]
MHAVLNWRPDEILSYPEAPGEDHSIRPDVVRGSRMGRGRQKAKHTKVARELKYFSPNTDYTALERELTSSNDHDYSEEASKWAEYADDEDDSYVSDEEPHEQHEQRA